MIQAAPAASAAWATASPALSSQARDIQRLQDLQAELDTVRARVASRAHLQPPGGQKGDRLDSTEQVCQ